MPDDIDLPLERKNFQELADTLEASRDVGAQLFCAFLRLARVKTRLACSLQALPFHTIAAKGGTVSRPGGELIIAEPSYEEASSGDETAANIGCLALESGAATGGKGNDQHASSSRRSGGSRGERRTGVGPGTARNGSSASDHAFVDQRQAKWNLS